MEKRCGNGWTIKQNTQTNYDDSNAFLASKILDDEQLQEIFRISQSLPLLELKAVSPNATLVEKIKHLLVKLNETFF